MKYWIAVASAEHVEIGKREGFMQVCHGKAAPLRRVKAGDQVVYYSPVEIFGSKTVCQAFTAIGTVRSHSPYQVEMHEDFYPFRHDVEWRRATRAAIRPLLPVLDFTRGKRNWAFSMRFGLIEISQHDMHLIAAAMSASHENQLEQETKQHQLSLL